MITLLALALAAAAPSAPPELAPIAVAMREQVRDPSSITDLRLCPAVQAETAPGSPPAWTAIMFFNSRNGFGGMSGVRLFVAVFRDGRVTLIDPSLNGPPSETQVRQMETCARVDDAALREAMRR